MTLRLSRFAILVGFVAFSSPVAAQDAFPQGLWTDAERLSVIRIAPCPNAAPAARLSLCGVVVSDITPPPNASRPGTIVIRDLRQERGTWRGRADGEGMTVNVSLQSRGTNTAAVRFCVGILCDTETWTRVTGPVAAQR